MNSHKTSEKELDSLRNQSVADSRKFSLIEHKTVIVFISIAICIAGWFGASQMRSSVFPETNFPRCVILIDNGVMPANEMMANITRPIEEAMKDIPGVVQVKSATGRGAAEVNVFFDWQSDMVASELYVLGKIAQIKSRLPATATTNVSRLTFNAFPILGVSLTSDNIDLTDLWEIARYDIKPSFLTIPGVGSVDIVGGRRPEFHVIVDPLKLLQANLTLDEISIALAQSNIVVPVGYHTENYSLYLAVVDGRSVEQSNILKTVIRSSAAHPILLGDVAIIKKGSEPIFNRVSAEGKSAVLLNIRAQPNGSDVRKIAARLQSKMDNLKLTLPPGAKLSYFYDQSIFVDESEGSVWEAIFVGLLFAVLIIYLFLRNWTSALTAVVVIPVSILSTTLVMFSLGMSFNLMTLGGIAAAVGLIIDDAIVVTESIYDKLKSGVTRSDAIQQGVNNIIKPIIGSTLTPVVVFIPLTYLDGLPGVFFRALAITMVVSLLSSFVFAVTLTPVLSYFFSGSKSKESDNDIATRSLMPRLENIFRKILSSVIRRVWFTPLIIVITLGLSVEIYGDLESDFMPDMDEGGFIIDYRTSWGTSLQETDRLMHQAEKILQSFDDVEGYSRRTGARLALAIAEPNTGDFLVKLKTNRSHTTEEIKTLLRHQLNKRIPTVEWEFPGILGDLIGDLTWSPKPIEIKLYSTDDDWLRSKAEEVEAVISNVPGIVDVSNGIIMTGPTIVFKVRKEDAKRYGLTSQMIATNLKSALIGIKSSSVLQGDRNIAIRIKLKQDSSASLDRLKSLTVRTPKGSLVQLEQVADIKIDQGQMELHREDLRRLVAVTADLEDRDTGSAVREVKQRLAGAPSIDLSAIEFGGLFEQQTKAFENLLVVLFLGVVFVFTVLLIEFRSLSAPFSIVLGSTLALFGTLIALRLSGNSLNIISFLGAIIGVGIVAKNGILVLDLVHRYTGEGKSLEEAIVESGSRRLRPILMTTLATILAMLPMAWGISRGSDMLAPLAVSIIGSLSISMLFSLFVTPSTYYYFAKHKVGT